MEGDETASAFPFEPGRDAGHLLVAVRKERREGVRLREVQGLEGIAGKRNDVHPAGEADRKPIVRSGKGRVRHPEEAERTRLEGRGNRHRAAGLLPPGSRNRHR